MGVFAVAALVQAGAQRTADPAQTPVFRAGTAAVVLDVVVRDGRGRPVRDLRASEVTVREDGIVRPVQSFRLVERAAGGGGASLGNASATPDVLRLPTLVTLVFDHLTQNARSLARQAALEFVSRDPPADQWVAVYGLEQRLYALQPFTQEGSALKSAIARATGTATEGRDRFALVDREAADRLAAAAVGVVNTERPAVNTAAIGAAVSEARVGEVIDRMARMVESIDTQQRGHSTFFPLMALIKAQASLSGRKALLVFSEGLAIPPNLEEAYRSTISEANRANVSVYVVDARGLDTARALDPSRQMLDRSARNSQAQLAAGASQRPVTMEDVMSAETAEGALRADTQNALRALAEETGGALIGDTNDLGPALAARVRSDLDSYYEVGYTTASSPPDGRFRAIDVKVARRGLTVHSRSGYFALPETDAAPLLPYELPMLAAAAAAPPPQSFAYAARTLRFDQSARSIRHTLLVEIPLEQLTFQEDRRKHTYTLRFTTMALVKQTGGEIVQRFSESYPLEGPLDRLPALKRGRLRFKRHFSLEPGRYVVSVVARDQATERSSVKTFPLDVPDVAAGVQISDMTIVRSLEPAGETPDAVEDPLRTGTIRVAPNLELPISKAANAQVSAYLTIYPDPAGPAPALTFEFLRDGAIVGRSAVDLPPPDENGRIKYVASFPTETFPAGTYELKAIARQGSVTVDSRTQFTLVP